MRALIPNQLLIKNLNACRKKLGRWLLRFYLFALRYRRPKELYLTGWKFINRFSFLFRNSPKVENFGQLRWQDYVVKRVLTECKRYYPAFVVPISAVGDHSVIEELDNCPGGLIISVHTGMTAIYERFFEDMGRFATTITIRQKEYQDWGKLLGMKVLPDTIAKDENSLLEAKRRFAKGQFVVNAIDYVVDIDGKAGSQLFASPVFFRFAKLLNAPLYFSVAFVEKNGEIKVAFERAEMIEVEDMFVNFTSFIKRYTGTAKQWSLKVEPRPFI